MHIPQDENNRPQWIEREAWQFQREERFDLEASKRERFTPISTSTEDSEPVIITIPPPPEAT